MTQALPQLQHVLVPLDGSELARAALLPARRLVLNQPRPALTLLEVIEGGDMERMERLRTEALMRLRDVQNAICGSRRTRRARALGQEEALRVSLLVEHGDPAERILTAAGRTGVDALVMTTHGRTGLPRAVRGSVAEAVLRKSPVPLLVSTPSATRLTGPDRPFLRLLVPLDGSELAYEAIPLAATLALGSGAEVVLVRVEEDGGKSEGCLEVAGERLVGTGVKPNKVWHEVVSGPPAESLLAAVDRHRIDLVVMSTHGRRGFDRLRLGSVAEEVLRHAPCPVLVRRGAPAA